MLCPQRHHTPQQVLHVNQPTILFARAEADIHHLHGQLYKARSTQHARISYQHAFLFARAEADIHHLHGQLYKAQSTQQAARGGPSAPERALFRPAYLEVEVADTEQL